MDWQTIDSAPRNAKTIRVRNAKGEYDAHYADSDGGGEQPAFRGWFEAVKDGAGKVLFYAEIDPPSHWLPDREKPN